ncbi:MAG: hypothetical protein ACR2G2_06815 [Pseudonocardia sp.]
MTRASTSTPSPRAAPTADDSQPMLDGQRPRAEQLLVGGFTVIPMLALAAAVPLAWGWGLSWLDVSCCTTSPGRSTPSAT